MVRLVEDPRSFMHDIIRQGMEILNRHLKKATDGSGYEFIIMVMPYHLTQVKHLSTEQRTLMEKKVAIAAQRELAGLLKEEGKGMI